MAIRAVSTWMKTRFGSSIRLDRQRPLAATIFPRKPLACFNKRRTDHDEERGLDGVLVPRGLAPSFLHGINHPGHQSRRHRAVSNSHHPAAGDLGRIFQDTATRPNKYAGAASRRIEGKEPCFNHASA